MLRPQAKSKLVFMVGLLFLGALFGASCAPPHSFDSRLRSIVRPYAFSIVKWEAGAVWQEIQEVVRVRDEETGEGVKKVLQYFSSVQRMRAINAEIASINAAVKSGDMASLEAELKERQQNVASAEAIEKIIESQLRKTLSEQGIFNPLSKTKLGFPPVNFRLSPPPYLLVVSPRDRIESIRDILLLQGITLEEVEDIESGVDEMGVSSLVVELGGFAGTYPSFVSVDSDLRFTLDTAAEEWVHQYLAFTPLGFRYVLDLLGISRNYDIATMNETLASMVGKEIGSTVFEKYYNHPESGDNQPQPADSAFDFNGEMREIRKQVDKYLAGGEIDLAEQYMEQERQFLATRGYHIRKLNQAYFAFHGTYADSPTSVSPIGLEMKRLRASSSSLKEFLETAAGMTSRQDLAESVK